MNDDAIDRMLRDTLNNGGATYHRSGRPTRARRSWAVGLWPGTFAKSAPPQETYSYWKLYDWFREAVKSALGLRWSDEDGAEHLLTDYVGAWKDDDGVIHVDPVRLTRSHEVAIEFGRVMRQQSIYNFETGENEAISAVA